MEREKYAGDCASSSNVAEVNHSYKLDVINSQGIHENTAGEQNPFERRNNKHLLSDFGAFVHLLKSNLGLGVLAMPYAFMNAGTILGTVGTLILLFIGFHCYHLMVASSHILCHKMNVPSLTYPGTVEYAFKFGPKSLQKYSRLSRILMDNFFMWGCYVGLFVYVVFVATAVKQVAEYFSNGLSLDIRLYILFLSPIFYGLGFIKNLKFLVPFSIAANFCVISTYAITIYFIFQDIPPVEDRKYFASISTVPIFLSVSMFAVEAINMVMQIENEMKNPTHFLGCFGVLNIAAIFIIMFCVAIGLVGYLKFGDETKPSVTLNLPPDSIPAQAAKTLMAVGILITFGLFFHVPTQMLFETFKKRLTEKWHYYSVRVFIVTLILAICVAVPNLGPATSLFGAIFLSTIGLLVPAFVDTIMKWNESLGILKWRLWKNVIIMVLAIITSVTGAYMSILDIIESYV